MASESSVTEIAADFASRILAAVPSSDSTPDFIANAVSGYLSVRNGPDGHDVVYRQRVVDDGCTSEGIEKYDEATTRSDDTVVEDVIADLTAALAKLAKEKKPIDPADKKQHGKIRFLAYNLLSKRYDYNAVTPRQRIPLPMLAEILVKGAFPGEGAGKFTGFVPSKLREDGPAGEDLARAAGTKRVRDASTSGADTAVSEGPSA